MGTLKTTEFHRAYISCSIFFQVNTLLQLENIASYPFMTKLINSNEVYLHALWFDVATGEVNYFSRQKQHFVEIRDSNFEELLGSEMDNAVS